MKIYAGMIAYNEEWIIECSLKSIYEYVDEIIVIDGSPFGPSTDKTAQIAKSIGPKVKVFSGTFKDSEGLDPEKLQRQTLLDKMEKDKDNWYIIKDADEIYMDEEIGRLISHLQHSDGKTTMFTYPHIQFIRDCWHYCSSKNEKKYDKKKYCSLPTTHRVLRLLPGIKYFHYHMVGASKDAIKFRITLHDVSFFHYGWALSKEKYLYKMYWRFLFIHKRNPDEWEKYRKEVAIPQWECWQRLESNSNEYDVKAYDGPQPKCIQPLIETIWRK